MVSSSGRGEVERVVVHADERVATGVAGAACVPEAAFGVLVLTGTHGPAGTVVELDDDPDPLDLVEPDDLDLLRLPLRRVEAVGWEHGVTFLGVGHKPEREEGDRGSQGQDHLQALSHDGTFFQFETMDGFRLRRGTWRSPRHSPKCCGCPALSAPSTAG